MWFRCIPTFFALIVLTACFEIPGSSDDASLSQDRSLGEQTPGGVDDERSLNANESNEIIALTSEGEITLAELDEALQISLFDLEWRKYELRKQMLKELIDYQAQIQTEGDEFFASINLQPPYPPRLELPEDKRLVDGRADAPINIAVFCSYQSSHCARLQVIIKQMKAHYGRAVAFRYYDYPQSFHRYGKVAANAVHCAAEQGHMTAFQDGVYADQSKLDRSRLLLIAEQLDIDINTFDHCMNEQRYFSQIAGDISLAHSIGLGNVPVLFINGLYAKGPNSFDAFGFYIDQELARINIDWRKYQQDESSAELASNDANDRVGTNDLHEDQSVESDEPAVEEALRTKGWDKRVVQPKGELFLNKDWVTNQLDKRSELEEHFHRADHIVEGHRLVKLKGIEDQKFYRTLSLQEGDVVLRVNDEWVHEDNNPLWERLADNEHVTLLVMREGYPVRYDFRIQ